MSNTYYISASGSSGNSGLSSLLPKNSYASALAISGAGDTFLGHGGDTFRETVLLRATSQTIDAYGTSRPIIDGSNIIGPFTPSTPPRYITSVATQPNLVLVNGTRANKGSSATTLANGEWFWASGTLFYRSDAGSPASLGLVIEAAQRGACVDTNGFNNFTLRSTVLRMSNADESAVYAHFSPDSYLIDDMVIEDHYGAGIHINGTSTGGTTQHTEIARCGTYGVWWSHPQNLLQYALYLNVHDCGWRTDGAADFAAGLGGAVQSGEWGFCTSTANGAGSQLPGRAHGYYLVIGVTSCTLWIHDSEASFHTQGDGFKADSSCRFSNNSSHDNVYQGYELGFNETQNILIEGDYNIAYNNGHSAVSIQHGSTGSGTLSVKWYHGTHYQNCTVTQAEISLFSDLALLDVRNCISVALSTRKFFQTPGTMTGTVTSDYNCYFGGSATPFGWLNVSQSFSAYKSSSGFDAHSVNADPTFTNAGAHDFTLQAGSPAIDAGIHIAGIDDGYVGSAPDMGAFESDFSGAVTGTAHSTMGGVASAATGTVAGAGSGGSTMGGVASAATGFVSLAITGTAAAVLGGVRSAASGSVAVSVAGPDAPLPWLIPPDWSQPVEFTSAWKTDVLEGEDATEQRVALRALPAESMKYSAKLTTQANNGFLTELLAESPTGRFNIPRWFDASTLTADLSIGGTTVTCDTTDRGFTIGGAALIWRRATGVYEVRAITGIASGALTTDAATKAWVGSTDVEVLPIAPAWLTLPLTRHYEGGVLSSLDVACEWEAAPLPAIGPTESVAATLTIGCDVGVVPYLGNYIALYAYVLDADGIEIPEALVTWSTSDAVHFSLQPVGPYGQTAILRSLSGVLTSTTTITATSGAITGTRMVVA